MPDTRSCTYEDLYYEMWEISQRYSQITQFRVVGKSHDERMIPMVELGKGNTCIFCISGLTGLDRQTPGFLIQMLLEYVKAWENGWKIEEIYDIREFLEKWRICFIPVLNPDGYEIYAGDSQSDLSPDASNAGNSGKRVYRKCKRDGSQEKFSYAVLSEEAGHAAAGKRK